MNAGESTKGVGTFLAEQEVRVRGRTYRVERQAEETNLDTGYRLVGVRGATYKLWKNLRHPEYLFAVPARLVSNAMEGLWFEVENGQLVVR